LVENFVGLKKHNKKEKSILQRKVRSKSNDKTVCKKGLFELIKWRYHGQTRPSSR